MPDITDETPLSEMVGFTADRVDAVKGPANGIGFLVMKSLDDPEIDAAVEAAHADTTPAAKAEWSKAYMDDLPDSAFAYIEPGGEKVDGKTEPRSKRHFPIKDKDGELDEAHVRDALGRAEQSPFGAKALPKIKAAAKKLGIDVAEKAEDVDAGSQDPGSSEPGSPVWEAADAANLKAVAEALAALRPRIVEAADREREEVLAGDTADIEDVWDLQDAVSALDCVTAIVARLSYTEATEAGDGTAAKTSALTLEQSEAVKAASSILAGLVGEPTAQEAEVLKSEVEQMLAPVYKALGLTADGQPIEDAAVKAGDAQPGDAAGGEAGAQTGTAVKGADITDPAAEAETGAGTGTAAKAADAAPAAADITEVLKSAAGEAFKAAFEPVADAVKGLGELVNGLEERLQVVENTPAQGGPLLGAAAAGNAALRAPGPTGGLPADVISEAVKAISDPQERADVATRLSQAALAQHFGG